MTNKVALMNENDNDYHLDLQVKIANSFYFFNFASSWSFFLLSETTSTKIATKRFKIIIEDMITKLMKYIQAIGYISNIGSITASHEDNVIIWVSVIKASPRSSNLPPSIFSNKITPATAYIYKTMKINNKT